MAILSTNRHVLVVYLIAALLSPLACARSDPSRARSFDFNALAVANQITIIGLGGVTVGKVTDRDRVEATVRYCSGKKEGWTEAWRGPSAGIVALRFYKDSKYIDELQIDKDYLVYGGYHLMVPPEEINSLVQMLGVDVFHLPKGDIEENRR